MYIEKRKVTRKEIKRISLKINIIIVIVFALIFFVFWNRQIIQNQYYSNLASRNIRKYLGVKAPRGFIRDRNGKSLAENKLNFGLFLIRENTDNINRSIDFASSLLNVERDVIARRVEKYKDYPEFFMIPIRKNVTLEKIIYVESRSEELPEFKIEIEPARTYPHKYRILPRLLMPPLLWIPGSSHLATDRFLVPFYKPIAD